MTKIPRPPRPPKSLRAPKPPKPPKAPRRRVLHFVTGGFSGATQVAVDLCRASLEGRRIEPILVLRKKRNTDMARVEALRSRGLKVFVVPGWAHWLTILSLRNICREQRPDVLVAHGFPEHLLGRWAGLWARVPRLVQVEHNSRERYSAWKRWQARWLARRSARLVGVSEGVRQQLVALGMPAEKTLAIPNGVALDRFDGAPAQDFARRENAIVMSARFARQKDQATLIRAVGLLKDRGLTPMLYLAGAGKSSYRREAEQLVRDLELGGQVQFLGHHGRMPELLIGKRICVLSTHWEGMPLALVEGMAAGCACVASLVPGVEGLLEDGKTGLLVPPRNPAALSHRLEMLLRDEALAAKLGAAARERALAEHGVALMTRRYEALFLDL